MSRHEEEAWEKSVLAEVDRELHDDGHGAPGLIGSAIKVFHSRRAWGRERRGGPETIVLARRPDGKGYRQVHLGRRDGVLDDVAHHGLLHIPEEDRYDALQHAVEEEIGRQRNR